VPQHCQELVLGGVGGTRLVARCPVEIALWIDVGLPGESDVRRHAAARDRLSSLRTAGARRAEVDAWWELNTIEILKSSHSPDELAQLAGLTQRDMRLDCPVQEGSVWMGSGTPGVSVGAKNPARHARRHPV